MVGRFVVSRGDVHRARGWSLEPDLRLAHLGGKEGETVNGSFQPLFSRVLGANNTLSIMLSHAGLGTQADPRLPGKPEALPGVGCDLARPPHSQAN